MNAGDSKIEFHLAAEVAWGLLLQADVATNGAEDFDEFCDHGGQNHKTAGRTFTGGSDFFLKRFFSPRQVHQA